MLLRALPLLRLCLLLVPTAFLVACGGGGGGSPAQLPPEDPPTLDMFATERITLDGVVYEAYFAVTDKEQRRGLKFATADQIAPLPDGTPRGMIFPFASDQIVSFTMENVFEALDIAFIRADGTIAEIHAMQPQDLSLTTPGEPIRYAFEVPQGDFATRGIEVGDMLQLPLPTP